MNRRALLKALPAAAVAGAVPAVVVASEETPVMRAYREYRAYLDWANSSEMSEEAFEAVVEKFSHYADRVVKAPSRGPADTAIKLLAAVEDWEGLYGHPHRDELYAEARALVAA